MPRSGQIIPEHSYPHQMVVINDNTEYSRTLSSDSGNTNMLFVLMSPKGIDRQMFTIRGESEFMSKVGLGPFSTYGQPLLNAYAAAQSGAATLHILRITAPDATYANMTIVAKYKEGEDGNIDVKFGKAVISNCINVEGSLFEDMYQAPTDPDEEGWTTVELFTFVCKGRGAWGNNISFRISNYAQGDKSNNYKNYVLEMYENSSIGLNKISDYIVAFNEDAIVSEVSLFAEAKVNDPDTGSDFVQLKVNTDGFKTLYDVYKAANPDVSISFDEFDPLLGLNKYTAKPIENWTIDTISEDAVSVQETTGIFLEGGDDGIFAYQSDRETAKKREELIEAAYKAAYSGETDPHIKSKRRYPTNFIMDAGFSTDLKNTIAALGTTRGDCVVILDGGTGLTTKRDIFDIANAIDTIASNRIHTIEGYYGKIKDPYSKKLVTVTGTWWLCSAYPIHIQENEAKHVPLAGNAFGAISGFIDGSIYPVYDEDIDSEVMDELCDERINFAKVDPRQNVVRATQTTRQDKLSALSELNNVLILLDIKRDCENLVAMYEYNFSEAADLARFNRDAENLLMGYTNTQIRSIKAYFGKNAWESERGILHMYVEFVHKDLVKTTIIEIDVNR